MKLSTAFSGLAALALATLASATAADPAAATATQQRRTAAIYIQPISQDPSSSQPIPLATLEYDSVPGASSSSSTENTAAAATAEEDEEEDERRRGPKAEIEILAYEAPELPEDARLVRVGVWDEAAAGWASGTTVASADNFAKGYAPTLAVTVSRSSSSSRSHQQGGGDIIGVAIKGVAVDAGYTRDFGPKAVLLRTGPGRQVDLNRPVVLSPEGRKVEPEPEKSLLQK